MVGPQGVSIIDFDYTLPDDRIARHPLSERDAAKVVVWRDGSISETCFRDIGRCLFPNTLLLLNDTKVIQARLLFQKETGSVVEIFCLEPLEPCEAEQALAIRGEALWKCFIGNNKKWKSGDLQLANPPQNSDINLRASRIAQIKDAWIVKFRWNSNYCFSQVLEEVGEIPLPPYLHRKAELQDRDDYQTVFAHVEGSVAAPTAGLHFTGENLRDLQKDFNVAIGKVTLHVGAGTFKPVTEKTIGEHVMHTEKILVPLATLHKIKDHLSSNIIPVGTTSVRTLESLYWHAVKRKMFGDDYGHLVNVLQWDAYNEDFQGVLSREEAIDFLIHDMETHKMEVLYGQTQMMIAPGYEYKFTSGIITNFHQPGSTLLLLVAALIGDAWKQIYDYALQHDFRFLSYGDGCLLFPSKRK